MACSLRSVLRADSAKSCGSIQVRTSGVLNIAAGLAVAWVLVAVAFQGSSVHGVYFWWSPRIVAPLTVDAVMGLLLLSAGVRQLRCRAPNARVYVGIGMLIPTAVANGMSAADSGVWRIFVSYVIALVLSAISLRHARVVATAPPN